MVKDKFHRLSVDGSNYEIALKVEFSPLSALKNETIQECIEFAYKMTLGKQGAHRNHRSGGSVLRSEFDIFADAFQGKLSEFAFANIVHKKYGVVKPDLSISGLGKWDTVDFELKELKVAIKSTKFFGNLLLLETADWNEDGQYLPNRDQHSVYDIIVLIRIFPDIHKILKNNIQNIRPAYQLQDLSNLIIGNKWTYDCPGYINHDELVYIIRNRFKLPKNSTLNGKTRMDADNYYIQSGDLNSIDKFLRN